MNRKGFYFVFLFRQHTALTFNSYDLMNNMKNPLSIILALNKPRIMLKTYLKLLK